MFLLINISFHLTATILSQNIIIVQLLHITIVLHLYYCPLIILRKIKILYLHFCLLQILS